MVEERVRMMLGMPPLAAISGCHVNLTVTDLERSAAWYCQVFGLVPIGDETVAPPVSDRSLRYRSLADPRTFSYVVGLIEHDRPSDDAFDERRTGLDHFGLHVPEVADLDEWVQHLDALGVRHSGVKTVDYGSAISFCDPDGIQLEVMVPSVDFWSGRVVSIMGGGDDS